MCIFNALLLDSYSGLTFTAIVLRRTCPLWSIHYQLLITRVGCRLQCVSTREQDSVIVHTVTMGQTLLTELSDRNLMHDLGCRPRSFAPLQAITKVRLTNADFKSTRVPRDKQLRGRACQPDYDVTLVLNWRCTEYSSIGLSIPLGEGWSKMTCSRGILARPDMIAYI